MQVAGKGETASHIRQRLTDLEINPYNDSKLDQAVPKIWNAAGQDATEKLRRILYPMELY